MSAKFRHPWNNNVVTVKPFSVTSPLRISLREERDIGSASVYRSRMVRLYDVYITNNVSNVQRNSYSLIEIPETGILKYQGIPYVDVNGALSFTNPEYRTFALQCLKTPSIYATVLFNGGTLEIRYETAIPTSVEATLVRTKELLTYKYIKDSDDRELMFISTTQQILPGDKLQLSIKYPSTLTCISEINLDTYTSQITAPTPPTPTPPPPPEPLVLKPWNLYSGSKDSGYWGGGKLSSDGTFSIATFGNIETNVFELYTGSGINTTTSVSVNAGPVINYQAIPDTPTNLTTFALSTNGSKIVAAENGGYVYTSADSGATWTQRLTTQYWQSLASSADGTKLVAAAKSSRLYTSADSGETWTPRETSRQWTCVASSANGELLVAGVEYGRLYMSVNAGVTWRATGISANWVSVCMSESGNTLFAVDLGGKIYKGRTGREYINGVSTFSILWAPIAQPIVRYWQSIACDLLGVVVVAAAQGSEGDLFVSTDSGTTWSGLNTPKRQWYGVSVSGNGKRIVATTDGLDFIYKIDRTFELPSA